MTDHYDALETCEPAMREADLFSRLPDVLRRAMAAPAYAERLKGIDPAGVTGRAALARLPVLRKSDLPALHKAAPPFGGFVTGLPGSFGRLFTSPGPIFEPESTHADPWRGARALFAAGFRPGDVVLNTFSYHLTPGGFIFDASARALRCAVIPAGPGNTEAQFELIEAYRPVGYSGTPDFLKILLDAAASAGRDVSSIKRAVVSGAAFPKSLQEEIKSRGVEAYQAFGTADLGLVAFETPAREGSRGRRRRDRRHLARPRSPLDSSRARGSYGGTARPELLRTQQHAHQGLDGPRRSDHQDQGHVRAARADRGDRQASSRAGAIASRRDTRGRDRRDDAESGMHLTERGLAGSIGGIPACRHQARWFDRIGAVRLAAERRQGDC
jgi:hypothetical protein